LRKKMRRGGMTSTPPSSLQNYNIGFHARGGRGDVKGNKKVGRALTQTGAMHRPATAHRHERLITGDSFRPQYGGGERRRQGLVQEGIRTSSCDQTCKTGGGTRLCSSSFQEAKRKSDSGKHYWRGAIGSDTLRKKSDGKAAQQEKEQGRRILNRRGSTVLSLGSWNHP